MLDRILADMLMKVLVVIVGRDKNGHFERYIIVDILEPILKAKLPQHVLDIVQICRDDLAKQGF